ncbi:MAG: hypothetical protein MJ173_00515 [Clostridia bacterium]|nr:hypothetical protein [Clostridia bacterium]
MGLSTILICVAFASFAVSYGWGMRGTVIGGEKGAMLPGLYLGLILAWFAGGGIRENFMIPAAAGLMGMTFGGTEPYGDTIHFVLCREDKEHYNPVRGYTGLAVKGGLWFGVAGGFIALSMSAMSGKYSAAGLVVFCLLIPVIGIAGYRIFNWPYNKESGKFPAIYFCYESREEWGSNLAIMLTMLGIGIFRNDNLLTSLISGGFAFGFIGWLVAIKFYDLCIHPMKNGRFIFGDKIDRKRIDGWKVMEFTLGAIGGMGVSLVFCLSGKEINAINEAIALNGVFNPIAKAEPFMPFVILASAAAVIVINVYEYLVEKKGGSYNSFVMDLIERPFFNVVPMIFVLLGSNGAARLMTVFMLIFVVSVKSIADRFPKGKSIVFPAAVFVSATVLTLVLDFVKGGYSAFDIIFAGGLPYIAAELFFRYYRGRKVEKKSMKELYANGSFPVVMGYMIIQVAIICVISAFIF